MTFAHPEWLFLLPAAAVLGLLEGLRTLRAQNLTRSFGKLPDPWLDWNPWFVALGTLCLVMALAQPVLEKGERLLPAGGQDSIFLVDVSRSMLSSDQPPSRLDRAKAALVDASQHFQGDRVSLYAFAGSTVLKVPLTRDEGFFRQSVEDLSPSSVARGGSVLGDALRFVLDTQLTADSLPNTVVFLLTDGGDQESFPLEVAKRLGAKGISLVILGFGTDQGAAVPAAEGDKPLMYQGREVTSSLNRSLLEDMARATPGGLFQSVAEAGSDLSDLYIRHHRSGPGISSGERIKNLTDLSLWPLAFGLVFFLVPGVLSWARRKP